MPGLLSEANTALSICSVRSFQLFALHNGRLIRYHWVLLLGVANLARLVQLVNRWLGSSGDWSREGIRVLSTRLVLHRVHQGSIASWWITISNTTFHNIELAACIVCSNAANPPMSQRWTLHYTWTGCLLWLCFELFNILLESTMSSECCRWRHANFTALVICCQQSRLSEVASSTYFITTSFVCRWRSVSELMCWRLVVHHLIHHHLSMALYLWLWVDDVIASRAIEMVNVVF